MRALLHDLLVHQTALLDELRERPLEAVHRLFAGDRDPAASRLPMPVQILTWLLVPRRRQRLFGRAALRLLGVK